MSRIRMWPDGRLVATAFAWLAAVSGIGSIGPDRSGQAAVPSTNRLVSAASEYIRRYQEDFRYLVADEDAEQQVLAAGRPEGEPSERRVTRGEMFITYLDAQRHWSAVHDVIEVDGVPVADRDELAGQLRDGEFSSVARRVLARNERFNIGRVRRNFNDPMLALLPFGPEQRGRFSFSRRSVDQPAGGPMLVIVAFEERERPTIVRDLGGRPVFAKGEILIEAETGVVRRTTVAFRHDDIAANLTTEFSWAAKLGLWVPAVFSERYAARREGRDEVTVVRSRYSNYRRFEVTGRLR